MTELKFTVTVRSWRAFNASLVAGELEAFTAALVEFQTHYKPLMAVAITDPQPTQPNEPALSAHD